MAYAYMHISGESDPGRVILDLSVSEAQFVRGLVDSVTEEDDATQKAADEIWSTLTDFVPRHSPWTMCGSVTCRHLPDQEPLEFPEDGGSDGMD